MPNFEEQLPEEWLFRGARDYVQRLYRDSRRPARLQLTLDNGQAITWDIPEHWQTPPPTPPPGPAAQPGNCAPSPDYSTLLWFGTPFYFGEQEARVVAVLHQAYQAGAPEVGTRHLLKVSQSTATRLSDVFRGNPAWGWLIRKGHNRGTYRLATVQEIQAGAQAQSEED